MRVRLSCPSCNTAFTLPALPEHRRAQCPRCGDVFPIHSYTELPDDATTKADAPAITVHIRPRWPRLLVAGSAVALVIIVLALGWGLYDISRGMRDLQNADPPRDDTPALTAKPPSQLVALGYLRADCNIVFAVQPGPLLHYAARTNQDTRDVLAQAGLPEAARNVIDQLGVTLPQIDHIAGGVNIGEGEDALRIALVLVLKQPLADEDEFLKKLKAKPVAGKKPRHDVLVGRFPLTLTRVSPTVWVFGLDEKDFDAVDKGGYGPGGTQFRGGEQSGLRGMIATVPPEAAVWVAADDDRDWTQKTLIKAFSNTPEVKKWLPTVRAGRGGVLAVNLGEQPRMRVFVRAADDATGARVREYFAARATEMEAATSGGDGANALFDSPFDPSTSGKLLQRFLSDAGR